MVNTGAPSRGCNTCKERKIKCDETKPTCQKCAKSGRVCPGVPDHFEVVVRHETRKIEQRIQRASKNKTSSGIHGAIRKESQQPHIPRSNGNYTYKLPSTRQTLYDNYRARSEPILRTTTPTIVSLDISIETKAVARFFNSFMSSGNNIGALGIFDCVSPMYQELSIHSVVHQTVDSLALLMNARMPGFEHLRKEAFLKHADALSRLREALADPIESKEDGTLLATIFLTMYELFKATSDAVPNFFSHNQGAIALMQHRGIGQLKHERSLLLFRSARLQMIMSHIHASKHIPPFTEECPNWDCDTMGMNEVTLLSHIGIEAGALRADLWDLFHKDYAFITDEKVRNILSRATAADARFVEWYHNLPLTWRYWVVGITTDFDRPDMPAMSRFYPGPIHAYKNAHVSWMLNCYRQLRIYTNAVEIRCLKWLVPDNEADLMKSKVVGPQVQVIQQMVDDICASTPYQLGYVRDPPPNGVSFPEDMPDVIPNGRGAYFSLIPLFASTLMECIPDKQRMWLKGRLRAIARINGVRMGIVLAQARPGAIFFGLPFLGNPQKYVQWDQEEIEGVAQEQHIGANPFGFR